MTDKNINDTAIEKIARVIRRDVLFEGRDFDLEICNAEEVAQEILNLINCNESTIHNESVDYSNNQNKGER